MKVNFPYSLGDRVTIKLLGVEGIVCGLYKGFSGVRLEVNFVENGVYQTKYFFPQQIDVCSEKPGFITPIQEP